MIHEKPVHERSVSHDDPLGRRAFLAALATLPFATELLRGAPAAEASQTLSYRPADPIDWDDVARQYLIAEGMAYFDCGSLSPMPAPVFYSLVDAYRALANYPMHREVLRERRREEKPVIASFLGAAADEIAVVRNTTEGLSVVAAGLDLGKGDEVLLSNYEHPSGLGPWQIRQARHGVAVKEVGVPLEPASAGEVVQRFDEAAGPRTRVLCVSHITTYTGLVLPVQQLCAWARQRGIVSVIDGAHAPGMLPVDLKALGCDAYACSPHKWLNAPQGTGLLYLRKEIQDRVWPSVADAGWQRAEGMAKFERLGQIPDPLAVSIAAAVSFQTALGTFAIRNRILELATRLREGIATIQGARLLTPRSSEFSGGITTFSLDGQPNAKLSQWLKARHNLVVDTAGRDLNGIRVSTHIYNSFEQIDRLVAALGDAAAGSLA